MGYLERKIIKMRVDLKFGLTIVYEQHINTLSFFSKYILKVRSVHIESDISLYIGSTVVFVFIQSFLCLDKIYINLESIRTKHIGPLQLGLSRV